MSYNLHELLLLALLQRSLTLVCRKGSFDETSGPSQVEADTVTFIMHYVGTEPSRLKLMTFYLMLVKVCTVCVYENSAVDFG